MQFFLPPCRHLHPVCSAGLCLALSIAFSGCIPLRSETIVDGRTQKIRDYESADPLTRPPVRILSSPDKPEMAVVSIRNRDHWFYIDDRDIESKKSFSFLMILLQLQASHESGKAPVVTIGTGS